MKPFKIYIGYDPRDHDAYRVVEHTLKENATIPIECIPIREWELRQRGIYWRAYHVDETGQAWDDRDGKPFSTQFSFTRFAVPAMTDYVDDWVLFIDADMMFRGDVAELVDCADNEKAVMCVQHSHQPKEGVKMDGMIQTVYDRKNWSSMMLMRPSRLRDLDTFALNNWTGGNLHAMRWCPTELIGDVPKTWNFLAGYDDPAECDPKNVHFTLGTPDMEHSVRTPWDGEWIAALSRARRGVMDYAAGAENAAS